MPSATATSLALNRSQSTRSRRARSQTRTPRRGSEYHPYHPTGEAALVILTAVAGIIWLVWPVGFWLHLLGSFIFFVIVPTTMLRIYWPKLGLDDIGWRLPSHPRQPLAYGLIVTAICFLPLLIFLTASEPAALTAVDPTTPWLAWLISQGLVAVLLLTDAAFFTGLILFRLSHLMHPWIAIVVVGLLMTVTQILLPGTVGLLGLPISIAFAWIAWQTKSFVPVAAMQFLLSLTFDLIVKIS